MSTLNEARRLLERGKIYISVTSLIILLITTLYLSEVGMSGSFEKNLRCGLALTYNLTINDTTQPYGTTNK